MYPDAQNYYEVLEVESVATFEEIKKAYRKLVNIYHTDKHMSESKEVQKYAEEITKKINEAYETLKDSSKRQKYDQGLQSSEKYKSQHKANEKENLIQRIQELLETGKIEESLNAAKSLYELFLGDSECRDLYGAIAHTWALLLVEKEKFVQAEHYFNLALGVSVNEELKWQVKIDLEKVKATREHLEEETRKRKETEHKSRTEKQSENTQNYGKSQEAQQQNPASSYAKPQSDIKTQRFQFNVATASVVQRSGRHGAKIDCDINLSWKESEVFPEDVGGGVILEMILIPGGKFLMGSPTKEAERLNSENPQHLVTVAQFFMGKYPVTQAQWRVVAGFSKQKMDLHPDPSRFKGANRPVDQVSWQDAIEFCARLSAKTGRNYRLPSEGEWEYACRSGTTTPFHFGETITSDLANYDGKSTYGSTLKGKDRQETTSVGSFPGNIFGLFDMHGNVWEWCADPWHDTYEGAPSNGRVWEAGNSDQLLRVLRGGSWGFSPKSCRSAFRLRNAPDYKYFNVGFRVAFSPN